MQISGHMRPNSDDPDIQNRATNDQFGRFAARISGWLGSKWAFAGAGLIIVVWALTGPVFRYSDTWQLVINTGTTIVTFLMVFLIQNTQNRDARAINLKLDELIRAIDQARNTMIDIENLSDLAGRTAYSVRTTRTSRPRRSQSPRDKKVSELCQSSGMGSQSVLSQLAP